MVVEALIEELTSIFNILFNGCQRINVSPILASKWMWGKVYEACQAHKFTLLLGRKFDMQSPPILSMWTLDLQASLFKVAIERQCCCCFGASPHC